MKEKLLKLYQDRQTDFVEITSQFPNDTLGGPFLMSPSENYLKQNVRLLVIGQETNGWLDSPKNIHKMIRNYEVFNVGETYRSSPFWNITRKLEASLNASPFSCAWTNISKFDVNNKRASGIHEKEISKLDNLLIDEVKIAKPSICIFFTGPAFDNRIRQVYKGVEFIPLKGWTTTQFCKLKHPDLPEQTFRSYHPKYLRIRKLENRFLSYFANK